MATNEPFTPDPLAFFLTWTTYGSWLPGDDRGWADDRGVLREPSLRLTSSARRRLAGFAVSLTLAQREQVAQTIARHCQHRQWTLFAVACRSQHVHVVVSAPAYQPVTVSQQLKMWAARTLVSGGALAGRIWTRGCSRRRIYDERGLQAVVQYVAECQDRPIA
ncbi:MAG: transposase [Planctomycetota bacterium]